VILKIRKTRIKRVVVAWIMLFFLVLGCIALPTDFRWGYWFYGLIWGTATALIQFLFPGFFEERIEK
jgi:hypothetical protein